MAAQIDDEVSAVKNLFTAPAQLIIKNFPEVEPEQTTVYGGTDFDKDNLGGQFESPQVDFVEE